MDGCEGREDQKDDAKRQRDDETLAAGDGARGASEMLGTADECAFQRVRHRRRCLRKVRASFLTAAPRRSSSFPRPDRSGAFLSRSVTECRRKYRESTSEEER